MKILSLVIVLLLAGCSYTNRFAGVVVKESDLKNLRVGETKRGDIYKVLGTPTIVSVRDPKHILHYASEALKIAPDRSAIINNVVVYTFVLDDSDTLVTMERRSGFREISPNSTRTAPCYKKASFIEEFLASSAARFK